MGWVWTPKMGLAPAGTAGTPFKPFHSPVLALAQVAGYQNLREISIMLKSSHRTGGLRAKKTGLQRSMH